MNIVTYNIDLSKLEENNNKLISDLNKLMVDIDLLESSITKKTITDTLIPVLKKYTSKMTELVNKTKISSNKEVTSYE